MLRHTRPLQAPGEASITSALRSGVKRRKSMTCEWGLLNASPGRISQTLETWLVIAGIAAVVKWVASPQVALTNAEQSTPVASDRGALRVQILPASTPRDSFAPIWASDPWQPQQ